MMDLVRLETSTGVVLWVRLTGPWNGRQVQSLRDSLAGPALTDGGSVILDLSGLDHVDYRAVPQLIELGRWVESRGSGLWVVGLSDYVRRIFYFGGALDGREFLERHTVANAERGADERIADDRGAVERIVSEHVDDERDTVEPTASEQTAGGQASDDGAAGAGRAAERAAERLAAWARSLDGVPAGSDAVSRSRVRRRPAGLPAGRVRRLWLRPVPLAICETWNGFCQN